MEQQSRRSFIAGAAAAGLVAGAFGSIRAAHAQEYATPFGPSSQDAVNRMIKLAALKDGDVVADLGSGNGQIIIAAVKSNPKVRGWGVDLQEWLVKTATEEAAKQGVSDRAQFSQRNAFDVDLREASVINMWLFANLTRLLQPKILAEARPGTRVIVNGQLIGTENILGLWQPDQIDREGSSPIMLWIVPARVQGFWTWDLPLGGTTQTYDVIMNQAFQQAEGFARVGNRRESLTEVKLRGEDLSFVFDMTLTGVGRTKHEFSGKVNGDTIKGTVKVSMAESKPMELPWIARRVAKSGWFRPTGIDLK
ncbi:MAG: class I SAM-dependent methyltransferase [Burkholderiales bacterium]|nr:class I SAM-dependent methyltransferase [Burkholderiales bacterium]